MKAKIAPAMIEDEFRDAKYDLGKAKHSYEEADYKWATVQTYYSIFHLARALLYSEGYREKSHYALLVAIKEMFVKTGIIEAKYTDNFEDAMRLRQEADYRSEYSEGGAAETIENAEAMFDIVRGLLKRKY